jgi:hypothetical protein
MSDINWDSGCNITISSHSAIYIFFILDVDAKITGEL